MPIYEYRCEKGHTFDVMQRVGDEPVAECEVCGRPVSRVFHPPVVHFKGSGFYNTDYGTRKRQREQAAASADSKKSDGDKASKSEAKSDGAKSSSDGAAKTDGAKPAKDSAKPAPAKAK